MSDLLAALAEALRFWSRLPVPTLPVEVDPHAPPVMARLAPVAPLAGAIIGLLQAATLAVASLLGVPPLPAAVLAIATGVVVTGVMHEDALGDVADGFWGGRTIERRLEIMKDPRLGSYGAAALILVVGLRVAVVADLTARLGPAEAGLALVGAAAFARIAGLWPLVALPPARADGLGAVAARLDAARWRLGAAVGAVIAVAAGVGATGSALALLAPAIGLGLAYGLALLADRKIGGQTGDVCGAATLLAETAALLVLLASAAE